MYLYHIGGVLQGVGLLPRWIKVRGVEVVDFRSGKFQAQITLETFPSVSLLLMSRQLFSSIIATVTVYALEP